MTIDEAHIELEITVDKRATSQAPELSAEVLDYFINEAPDRFVKTRYSKNNIYQAGFEETQKRTDDLRTLVVTDKLSTVPVPYEDDNYAQVELEGAANQYWFFLRARAQVTTESCGTTWNRVKLVQQDDLEKVLDDPFNRPTSSRPVIYFENGNIISVSSNLFSIDALKVTYLKAPDRVDSLNIPQGQFNMPEHTHKEIIQLAADIIIENLESQRVQTMPSQLARTE